MPVCFSMRAVLDMISSDLKVFYKIATSGPFFDFTENWGHFRNYYGVLCSSKSSWRSICAIIELQSIAGRWRCAVIQWICSVWFWWIFSLNQCSTDRSVHDYLHQSGRLRRQLLRTSSPNILRSPFRYGLVMLVSNAKQIGALSAIGGISFHRVFGLLCNIHRCSSISDHQSSSMRRHFSIISLHGVLQFPSFPSYYLTFLRQSSLMSFHDLRCFSSLIGCSLPRSSHQHLVPSALLV